MSYDVHLSALVGVDDELVELEGTWRNYTCNLDPMWQAVDFWLPSLNGLKASDAAQTLERVVDDLEAEPDEWRRYDPSNGWGNYDGGLTFLKDILRRCRELPGAVVEVSW